NAHRINGLNGHATDRNGAHALPAAAPTKTPRVEPAPAPPADHDTDSIVRQLAEAQRQFSRRMLQGHRDFLRTMRAFAGLPGTAAASEAPPPRVKRRKRRPLAPEPVYRNGSIPWQDDDQKAPPPVPAPSPPSLPPPPEPTAASVA